MSSLLPVTDIESAVEFYTKKLDFEEAFRYEDFYAGIIKDGHSIHLKANGYSLDERKNKRDNEDPYLIFSVSYIEALYEKLSQASVKIVQALRDMPYGKEFYIADPDNNIIAFMEAK